LALNKDKVFKQADTYIKQNKIDKAIAEYERWVAENPTDWNTIRNIGDLYARLGRATEAIQKYSQIAEFYRKDGFNVRAIATYKMILRLDSQNEQAMRSLADLQKAQGLVMEAKVHYQALIELYGKAGQKKKALEVFKLLTEMDPTDVKVRYKYAEFLEREGRVAEAVAEYVGIADEFINKGLVAEATQILDRGLRIDPSNRQLRGKIAEAACLQGDYPKAIRLLEEIRDQNPRDVELLSRLGEAYMGAGNAAEATSAFRRLAELEPDNPQHAVRLAELSISQAKFDQALELISPAVDQNVSRREGERATALLQKILSREPRHVKTILKLVEVCTVLQNDSGRISAYDQLCEAYTQRGEYDRAADVAQQLIDLEPENAQHKDRLRFIKARLGGPPPQQPKPAAKPVAAERPAAPRPPARPAPPAPPPPPFAPLDAAKDLDSVLNESFAVEAFDNEPAAPPEPRTEEEVGVVNRLSPEDEEHIREKFTEAEVFVRYGLVEKAIDQLKDLLQSFPFHTGSREKLIEVYTDQGMNREAATQMVELAVIFDRLGDRERARQLREQAALLSPGVEKVAAAPAAEEEMELLIPQPESEFGEELELLSTEEQSLDFAAELAPQSAPASFAPVEEEIEIGVGSDAAEEAPVAFQEEPEVGVDFGTPAEESGLPGAEEFSIQVDLADQGAGSPSASETLEVSESSADAESAEEQEGFEITIDEPDSSAPALSAEEVAEVSAAAEEPVDFGGLDLGGEEGEDAGFSIELGGEADLGGEGGGGIETGLGSEADLGIEVEEPESVAVDSADPLADLQSPPPPPAAVARAAAKPPAAPPPPAPAPAARVEPPRAAAPPPRPAVPELAELNEVDEYVAVGLYEDARQTLADLLKKRPGDPRVVAKIEELGFSVSQLQSLGKPVAERPPSVAPPPSPREKPPVAPSPSADLFAGLASPAGPAQEEPLGVLAGGEGEEPLGSLESLVESPSEEPAPLEVEAGEQEEEFVDLASELSAEMFGTQSAVAEEPLAEASGPLTDPNLDQIFREFKRGVEKQLGSEDYDTRYNLGIAYKEMGLLDEAIAEFQLASKDETRLLECCSMLGLCFMEKGMPEIAIKWFEKGLKAAGRTEEEYHGLRYDLATAHEAAGEVERALELYKEIYRVNNKFRDVRERVRELQAAAAKK
jgi:pilus assembly protein FimV